MERLVLSAAKIAPPAADSVAALHRDTVEEVARAVEKNHVVVVGMAQNPVVKRARKLLDNEKIPFTYLEYGSYLSEWKRRLAIKLWAGFPTFPMVFVDGTLIGGCTELEKLRDGGGLKALGPLVGQTAAASLRRLDRLVSLVSLAHASEGSYRPGPLAQMSSR